MESLQFFHGHFSVSRQNSQRQRQIEMSLGVQARQHLFEDDHEEHGRATRNVAGPLGD